MPALTTAEKTLFTRDQLAQLSRLSAERRDEYLTPEEPDAGEFRASILTKWAKLTPGLTRARVNIIGVLGSSNRVPNYAPENDYTVAEMEAISRALVGGGKWNEQVADAVANGPDLTQRVEVLEGG